MTKAMILSLFNLVMIITMLGCSAPKNSHITDILGSACKIPCWHNIIPGVTDVNKLNGLLPMIPGVDIQEIFWQDPENWGKNYQLVGWDFIGKEIYGAIYQDNNVVYKILIMGEMDIRLDHFFQRYGEPDTIIINTENGHGFLWGSRLYYGINLVYKEGLVVSYKDNYEKNLVISPDKKIKRITFTTPVEVNGSIQNWSKHEIGPWNGYGPISIKGVDN